MPEELTELELTIMHDLIAHTKRVKGTDAMTRSENQECIDLAKEIAAKITEKTYKEVSDV
jgi:exosome complex RNA-binding protein Rrp42 (RNase PH superfamily)